MLFPFRSLDNLVLCVSSAARKHCSPAAAEWLQTVKTMLLGPAKATMKCKDEGGSLDPTVVFGIIIGVVLSALSIVTIALAYRRYQVKNFAHSSKFLTSSRSSWAASKSYNDAAPSVTVTPNSTAPLLNGSPHQCAKGKATMNGTKGITKDKPPGRLGNDYTALKEVR